MSNLQTRLSKVEDDSKKASTDAGQRRGQGHRPRGPRARRSRTPRPTPAAPTPTPRRRRPALAHPSPPRRGLLARMNPQARRATPPACAPLWSARPPARRPRQRKRGEAVHPGRPRSVQAAAAVLRLGGLPADRAAPGRRLQARGRRRDDEARQEGHGREEAGAARQGGRRGYPGRQRLQLRPPGTTPIRTGCPRGSPPTGAAGSTRTAGIAPARSQPAPRSPTAVPAATPRRQCRYGLATFINPRGGGSFDQVQNHAGGVAWSGPYMYLAETNFGLKVFDVRQIMRVPRSRRGDAHGSKFVLPEVGRYAYDDNDASLKFSTLSTRSAESRQRPALVVGEYETPDPDRTTEIARWVIDPETHLLRTVGANQAWKTDNWQFQGAITIGRRLFGSSSTGDRGRLYFGRPKASESAPNRRVRDCDWGYYPEGLERVRRQALVADRDAERANGVRSRPGPPRSSCAARADLERRGAPRMGRPSLASLDWTESG